MKIRESVTESEDLYIGESRIRRCVVCGQNTKQVVTEYIQNYLPNEPCNPKIDKFHSEIVLGWECSICGDEVDSIRIGYY